MENLLRPVYQDYINDLNTLGIVITYNNGSITDDFDVVVFIVVNDSEQLWQVEHYEIERRTTALNIVTESLLMELINTSSYHNVAELILYGRKIFERNGFIYNLKEQLKDFPHAKRDLRKTIEFGKFIKSYSEAKALYESSQYKDANSNILYSLHYLARLAVIEKGYYPRVTIWSQVKQIDLEIYKLYEEFIEGNEEIEKRIQLMIIAMDHVISNRAKAAVRHLLDVMKENTVWSYTDLTELPPIISYRLYLTEIISYLVEKDIIETVLEKTKNTGVYKRKYIVKHKEH
ncbi:hypothetical protein KFZ58_05300 [Virgibacillus sp. NKC19-16]|uniref:nucleotidyltransferase-like protein n=1 Tax=Virgibacillus salidurans TaxID=2831673 RepID=UPI001F32A8D8|nr:nucleotidyltransferase-like protein [Virgibacillus sp. NKC19-16]UJL47326.1 hypothetical protein KFZ58_05300 [Virgibacillus sp. NKC19-16]